MPSDLTKEELKSFTTLHVNKYNTQEWKYEKISEKL
jgi:lipoate-protein ligase A